MKCLYAPVVGLFCPFAPALGRVAAGGTFKSLTYKKAKQADLELHIHIPPDWKKEEKRPAIVFFFGGGRTDWSATQFEPQAAYLAGRG